VEGLTVIYIYCPKKSDSARALVKYLKEAGVEAERLWKAPTLPNAGLFVNWGAIWPKDRGFRVLNSQVIHNKYKELQILTSKGVECIESSLEYPGEGWLARRFKHQEARDLLAHLSTGDYYTKYREISQEFRVHVFQGKSIRLAMKVPRVEHPHPIFRSWGAGWKFSYGADAQKWASIPLRNLAKRAVKALGLDFGAVDIGRQPDGVFFVLEVNTRPGLEGGTVEAYGRHITSASE